MFFDATARIAASFHGPIGLTCVHLEREKNEYRHCAFETRQAPKLNQVSTLEHPHPLAL